jgi:hypothetical protein
MISGEEIKIVSSVTVRVETAMADIKRIQPGDGYDIISNETLDDDCSAHMLRQGNNNHHKLLNKKEIQYV